MKLSEHKFLIDENIQKPVIDFLKSLEIDILVAQENGLSGSKDTELLKIAYDESRIVLTHDSDFGTLAIANQLPFYGIVYLKPGHIKPENTIESVRSILNLENFTSPFIITVRNTGIQINVRIRQL